MIDGRDSVIREPHVIFESEKLRRSPIRRGSLGPPSPLSLEDAFSVLLVVTDCVWPD